MRVHQLEVERGKVVAMMESAGRTYVLPKQQPNPKPWSLYGSVHTSRTRRTNTRARTNLGIDSYKSPTLRLSPPRPRAGLVKTRCLTIRPSFRSDRMVGSSGRTLYTKARRYPSRVSQEQAQSFQPIEITPIAIDNPTAEKEMLSPSPGQIVNHQVLCPVGSNR